jgi:hypothetical protein
VSEHGRRAGERPDEVTGDERGDEGRHEPLQDVEQRDG